MNPAAIVFIKSFRIAVPNESIPLVPQDRANDFVKKNTISTFAEISRRSLNVFVCACVCVSLCVLAWRNFESIWWLVAAEGVELRPGTGEVRTRFTHTHANTHARTVWSSHWRLAVRSVRANCHSQMAGGRVGGCDCKRSVRVCSTNERPQDVCGCVSNRPQLPPVSDEIYDPSR